VALSARDLADAADQFSIADGILGRLGQREPAQYRFHPDLIEALIGLGQLDRAQDQLVLLTERARVFPRPWTLATGARCHGLLLAAEGDLDGAAAAMREALAFISPKTVEANLSRVYGKLGVHSRAQLVLAMSERDRQRTEWPG